jgi:hypothetical protein
MIIMGDMGTDTKIAVSTTTFDKYKPGKQKFFIQALTPTMEKTNQFNKSTASTDNILNKDVGALNIQLPGIGSTLELEVPKDVTRWFETKFIPKGSRFVLAFDSGDSTRPRIIGRDFNSEQGGYNNESDGGWSES